MDLLSYIEIKPLIGFPKDKLIDIYKKDDESSSGIDLNKLSKYVEPVMVMEVVDDNDSKLVHYNIRMRECN